MNVFIYLSKEKSVCYQLRKSVASLLLIRLLQGQYHLKGYEPKYLDAKSPVELKENKAAMAATISLPPKQRYHD